MNKLIFLIKKPKVVLVAGEGKETAAEAIREVLKKSFNLGKDVLVYQVESKNIDDFNFYLKKSKSVTLVLTHFGEYHPEKEFFGAEEMAVNPFKEMSALLPGNANLVLNFDDETVRDVKNNSRAHSLTFGFGARADIKATDVVLTQPPTPGTNFKINYEGNIVPVWLEKLFGKEQVYAALSAICVGELLGLNLVEISAALKSYRGYPGRMKLIEGIKKTWILDDSESAHPLSMSESLDVLKKIEVPGRKIAVLGDIIGIGKYTVESHEAVGEKIKGAADLLFAVGPRAKFYAEGAKKKGMAKNNIFYFYETKEAGLALQKELQKGDLVLVDGGREMKMSDIVREIKNF